MRKRIRLRDLRVGMVIEDIEQPQHFSGSLVVSQANLTQLLEAPVATVVINIKKGLDVSQSSLAGEGFTHSQFMSSMRRHFSDEEIKSARTTIQTVVPIMKQIVSEARLRNIFNTELAQEVVSGLMTDVMSNTGALLTMAKLKSRDEVTFRHSIAVSALMIAFGHRLGISEEGIEMLGLGGLVHDLGKALMPMSILSKTGVLTAEEFNLVKTHSRLGHEMLLQLEGIAPIVLDITLHHHERFDGLGYPDGLAGENIPYAARIAAVCDVYDALTTVRAYKRAWSEEEALDVMINSPGHFDPELLAAFTSQMVPLKKNGANPY